MRGKATSGRDHLDDVDMSGEDMEGYWDGIEGNGWAAGGIERRRVI